MPLKSERVFEYELFMFFLSLWINYGFHYEEVAREHTLMDPLFIRKDEAQECKLVQKMNQPERVQAKAARAKRRHEAEKDKPTKSKKRKVIRVYS